MPQARTCQNCGAELAAETPHCVSCLLELGVGLGEGWAEGGPRRFGDYDLLGEISQGGMGIVYRARQRSLNRLVALKMMQGGHLATPEQARQFRTEAEAVGRLTHPNVVRIFEVGEEEGRHFFSMDLVEGGSLESALSQGKFGLPTTKFATKQAWRQAQESIASFVAVAARAVQHSHRHGVLHRDLKPGNILIGEKGEPLLADFGIAKLLEGEGGDTVTDRPRGTPKYMAPEQAMGKRNKITVATDVYGLGAILYRLLTGHAPFKGETSLVILDQVMNREPVRPRVLSPRIDHELETICLKCLEKEPAKRYASAEALADDLERWVGHEPIQARPVATWERLAKWAHRRPAIAGLSFAVAIAVVLGILGTTWQWRHAVAKANAEASLYGKLQLLRINELFDEGRPHEGVASMANFVKRHPDHRVAKKRLAMELLHRGWPLPALKPMRHEAKVYSAEFSNDGRYIVTACADKKVRVWDAQTGLVVGKTLEHEDAVIRARFDGSGVKIITASLDRSARIFERRDATNFVELFRLDHDSPVTYAEFNADGSLVLTVCASGLAQCWNAQSGKPIGAPMAHAGELYAARFSPDGKRVVTASGNRGARLWDAASGLPATEPLTLEDVVKHVEFSPDGTKLATLGDRRLRLWDAHTGMPLTESWDIDFGKQSTDAKGGWMAPSAPKGLRPVLQSVLQSNGAVRVKREREDTSRIVKLILESVDVHPARFSPDSSLIITRGGLGPPRLWTNAASALLNFPMNDSGSGLAATLSMGSTSVDFSPDGLRALSTRGKYVDLWFGLSKLGESLLHTSIVRRAQFSPRGTEVLTVCDDHLVRLWDIRLGMPLGRFSHLRFAPRVTFNADRSLALGFVPNWKTRWQTSAVDDGGALVTSGQVIDSVMAGVWDTRTWLPVVDPFFLQLQENFFSQPADLKLYSGAGRINLLMHDGSGCQLFELASRNTNLVGRRIDGIPMDIGIGSNHTLALLRTGSKDDALRIVEVESGEVLCQLKPPPPGTNFAFAHFIRDSSQIFTATSNGTYTIWDARTGQPLLPTLIHQGRNPRGEFYPLNARVLTWTGDTLCQVWDTKKGGPPRLSLHHDAPVASAQFSPDGLRIVTKLTDGTAMIWNANDGTIVSEPLSLPFGEISAIEFLDEGTVLTGNNTGFKVWDLASGEPLSAATELPRYQQISVETDIRPPGQDIDGSLLARAAEVFAGLRQGANMKFNPPGDTELSDLRKVLDRRPFGGEKPDLLRWLVQDRSIRTITPWAEVTVPELIHDLCTDESKKSLIFHLPPDNPERWNGLLSVLHRFLCLAPNDSLFLSTLGECLSQNTGSEKNPWLDWLLQRSRTQTNQQKGRKPNWPSRDTDAGPQLVDLSHWYNASFSEHWHSVQDRGNNLASLTAGIHEIEGIRFDVRGIVQLASRQLDPKRDPKRPDYPTRVSLIRVGQKAPALHFLHGTAWPSPENTRIGIYLVHYVDGQSTEIPILYGQHVRNWQFWPEMSKEPDYPQAAWKGTQERWKGMEGYGVRLYRLSWNNPRPEVEISAIDFVSQNEDSAPFLIAITTDGPMIP